EADLVGPLGVGSSPQRPAGRRRRGPKSAFSVGRGTRERIVTAPARGMGHMRDGRNKTGVDPKSTGVSTGRRRHVRGRARPDGGAPDARPPKPPAPDDPTSNRKKNDDAVTRER